MQVHLANADNREAMLRDWHEAMYEIQIQAKTHLANADNRETKFRDWHEIMYIWLGEDTFGECR